jgi:P4 family phage/plasmid primase-like protien
MSERDLVLDVDEKHNGLYGLEVLQETYDIDADTYPSTLTGGGGYHFYMRLSEDQAAKWGTKFRETLKEYPGLEFKGLGRQVVIPGSIHPDTKEVYEFDDFSRLDVDEIPPPPDELLEKLLLTVDVYDKADSVEVSPWTPEQLGKVLSKLPVEEYATNADWFPILCASYHATAGLGVDPFVTWSTSDPKYSNHGDAIRARWDSLGNAAPTKRTAGTLYRELTKRKIPIPEGLPGAVSAAEEFADVPLPTNKEKPTLARVRSEIDVVTPTTDNSDLRPILDDICYLDPLDRHDALDALARQANKPRSVLTQTLRRVMESKKPIKAERPVTSMDAGDEITASALDTIFNRGLNIVCLAGQFWMYTGTHWKPADHDVVGKRVMSVVRDWARRNPQSKKTTAALTDEVLKTLKRETSTEADLLRLTSEPLPVINTLSGEIWIDEDTGKSEFREHNPKSYLTSCLDVKYDPHAKCPMFDDTLADIFGPLDDFREIIEYIWELIGYTIQPRKNIPHWWLFHGGGANGKTVVLKVIMALLGPSVLATQMSAFNGSNTHAEYDLVGKLALIDEDVEINTRLPGGFLKKITENKLMHANPKNQKPFSFVAATTVMMAANNYPLTSDVSAGIRRRARVIPFMREFSEAEQDLDRARKVIELELPGVLNKSLEGLCRLRQRGTFTHPRSIQGASYRWLCEANPIAAFMEDVFVKVSGENCDIDRVWIEYQFWTQEQGFRKQVKKKFLASIQSLGYNLSGKQLRGVKLISDSRGGI